MWKPNRSSIWAGRVAALLALSSAVLTAGAALAQDAPPPGPPGQQAPSSGSGAPEAPAQTGSSGQPDAPPAVQQTINGDATAWAEIEAAYKKLNSVSGYREKESGTGWFGQRIVNLSEVSLPNSAHTTGESGSSNVGSITIPAVASETVTVDNQTRFRVKEDGEPWGPWECRKAAPPAGGKGAASGVSVQSTVEALRGPDTAIEGTPVRTLMYTLVSTLTYPNQQQSTVTRKTTVYVDTQTGLPRRKIEEVRVKSTSSDGRGTTMTTDYYDYDAKIEITLPACEKER